MLIDVDSGSSCTPAYSRQKTWQSCKDEFAVELFLGDWNFWKARCGHYWRPLGAMHCDGEARAGKRIRRDGSN